MHKSQINATLKKLEKQFSKVKRSNYKHSQTDRTETKINSIVGTKRAYQTEQEDKGYVRRTIEYHKTQLEKLMEEVKRHENAILELERRQQPGVLDKLIQDCNNRIKALQNHLVQVRRDEVAELATQADELAEFIAAQEGVSVEELGGIIDGAS